MSFTHTVRDQRYDALAVVGFDFGFMVTDDGVPLLFGKDQRQDVSLQLHFRSTE